MVCVRASSSRSIVFNEPRENGVTMGKASRRERRAMRELAAKIERQAALMQGVLAAVAAGDHVRADELFHEACPTRFDMFAACYGIGYAVAAAARDVNPDASGMPITVELEAPDDADPVESHFIQDVCAFIAAAGNHDSEGALMVMDDAMNASEEHAGGFIGTLLSIGAAVAESDASS